jgi:hypothetical protein
MGKTSRYVNPESFWNRIIHETYSATNGKLIYKYNGRPLSAFLRGYKFVTLEELSDGTYIAYRAKTSQAPSEFIDFRFGRGAEPAFEVNPCHRNPAGDLWQGSEPRSCDLCRKPIGKTFMDAKTSQGAWGILCPQCHKTHGVGLGLGLGQRYDKKGGKWVQAGKAAPKRKSLYDCKSVSEMEEMCGDRDPFEFM